MSQIQFTPKIIIDGSTSNEPFVKFTQNYQWTSSNFCLHINNGYTNLNGIIINGGLNVNDTFYTSNNNNMSFNVTGNNNLIFKTNNLERLRIFNNGNIGIGTTNAQDYKVNINGSINTLSFFRNNINLDNIYLALNANCWLFNNTSKILYTDPNSNIANIGIGNTNPFGYLHIGSPNVANSDGNIVLSKNIDSKSTSRNFKLGYDADFNFIMGNLVNSVSGNDWTSQFLINYNAPANSLIISSSGNIGINTSITNIYKVNINGSLNAYSITSVDGHNISNLDYKNITLNSPNLKNLDNWNIIDNIIYNTNFNTSVGIGTSSISDTIGAITFNYKLNVNGNVNSTSYFMSGVNINSIYLDIAYAARTYLSIPVFNESNIWFKQFNSFGTTTIRLNNQNITNVIQLGIDDPLNWQNIYLNVLGKIKAKYLEGSGEFINNIIWTNINQATVPRFITIEQTAADYYNKIYIDTIYYNNIITNTAKLYASYSDLAKMQTNIDNVYSAIPPDVIAGIIADLSAQGQISIYHSNILGLPYKFNSSNYGFNANASLNPNNIITVGGTITASNLISEGIIYESNISLDNIYISSNNYIKNISNYETIVDRIKAQSTSEKIYPPELSKFNNSTSNIVSMSDYGNGLYIVQSSTMLLDTIPLSSNASLAPASNLFNSSNDTLPWQNDIGHTQYNYIASDAGNFNILDTTSNLKTGISINSVVQPLYGHWILLYYSEKFIATKIDIITKYNSETLKNTFPKNIYLIATNINILQQSQDTYNANNSYTWDILLNNIIITESDYAPYFGDNDLFKISFNIPKNITAYKYYKLIITSTIASRAVSIQQLKFYGIENKKEWMHSGNNIYSLSNISIGTINNLSPYILNINGDVYTSSNIYVNSNIGIGITSPLGNLHIGTPYSNSDGTLIISKNNNTSNRNFKFGYDSNFNFVLGDFGSNNDGSRKWTKQFYINSNAPENSFMINSYGNIGININNITSNQKLFVNGNLNVTGSINQSNINELNTFTSDIYASNNIFILSNLNVSNIFTSNINVSNYINVNGIIYASKNIGIGTSTNLNASLNIESLNNSIGIWNASSDLNTGNKISAFIGKNIDANNGFYNYYYHYENGYNNNYLSWATSLSGATSDILCMNSSKYVGIGITNPTSLFQIRNGGKFKISPDDDDENYPYALIGLNDIDNSENTKIYLNGLSKKIEYFASTGGHIFYTNNSIEQMRINNSGNVSIGTTSDIYKLNINGSLYSSSNIFACSNIGIGITTPLGNLHIASPHSSSDGTIIISKNDDVNNRNFKFGYDANFNFTLGDFGTSDDGSRTWIKQFYINSNAPENSLIINNTGFIGIGISVPLGNLHIGTPHTNSDGTIIISKNDNINNRNFKFGYDTNLNFVFGDFGTSDDGSRTWIKQFYINSNASENSLTINSNGNVGIGTRSALDQKLFINGNTTINNGVLNQISDDGYPNLFKNAILINTQINSLDYRLNVNGSVNIQSNLNTSNLFVNNITFLKGIVRIGQSPEEIGYNVYIDNNTCIKGDILCKNGNFTHNDGNFNINSTNFKISSSTISSFMGYVGIGTNTGINNILQVGDGGRLKIANTIDDFTVIGTINVITNTSNTRIILNGHNKTNNFGDIQYFTTNSGKHLFYSGGTTQNERFRIDSNGNVGIGTTNSENLKLNVNGNINAGGTGNINCLSLISSNSIDIGVDPLDTTKILNVYGSINVSSNISVASNISANNIISSNIDNYGTFSNIGNLVITGDIKQKGAYVFSGSVFNIGELTDTNKTFIIGGNIISSSNITAHSNIETTSLKTLFITNASNIYTSNIIVSGSTILNSNIIQNNDCPITLSGNLTLNSSTKDDQITINNTNQDKYSRIKFTNNDPINNYGYIGIGGTNVSDNYKNNVVIQSAKSIILNSGNNLTSLLISSNGNIGISTAIANNIFQIGDGGRLRIANNGTDYTIIGTSNINNNTLNTRIIINGYNNTGDIQYNATNTGKHLFYSNGGTNELMRIDNTGNVGIGTINSENFKLNVNGELNVQNLIKENSSYLSNVYVKLENLSNLNINNFNLKKKFGFNCIIKDKLVNNLLTYNSTPYFKYDIDLRLVTKYLTNTSNDYSVNYRLFNIKCFLTNCSFETFNIGIPNILQYDVYMSSNPYMQQSIPPTVSPKSALNICAIGTPENYKLDNILPSYITLLRYDNIGTNNFNYLSLVSPHSNLSVSFIIEDYLS